MITLNKDIDCFDAMKIITICCEEVIEQQIIPELSLIYTININQYSDFIKYIYLTESIIKSAAIVQQLRHIQNNLQLDKPSKELIQEIDQLKKNQNLTTKYNSIFDYYYHDQPQINIFLTTAESLFSHRAYIADLQHIIKLAHKGMSYTTDVAQYKIPATYYCYTKKFNAELSDFLQNIINDTFDIHNKKLYQKSDNLLISEEAFSSVVTTIAFRLQSTIRFIEHFYAAQELIEDKNSSHSGCSLDDFFIQFVGKIRSEALLI